MENPKTPMILRATATTAQIDDVCSRVQFPNNAICQRGNDALPDAGGRWDYGGAATSTAEDMADSSSSAIAPWPLLRQDAPAIACSLAAEIESNTCPICFELMKSPDYSPIVLYPCGHSFCAKCLAVHTVTNRKKTCPYCRQKIVSQALNVSLQKLINNFVALQKNPVPVDSFVGAQYSEKLRQVETRCKILHCALDNGIGYKNKLTKDVMATERKLLELQSEAKETKAKLEKATHDHQLVVCQIRENNDRLASLQRFQEEESAKVNMIQETLKNLQKECEKLKLFISNGG